MKKIILLLLFAVLSFVTACNVTNETSQVESHKTDISTIEDSKPKTNKNLVLAELFTSEG